MSVESDEQVNRPFDPGGALADGSFFSGATELEFDELLLQARTFVFDTTDDVYYDHDGAGPYLAFGTGGGSGIVAGATVATGSTITSGYTSEEDILDGFRQTSYNETDFSLYIGETGDYEPPTVANLFTGSGILTSSFTLALHIPDGETTIGTDQTIHDGDATGITLKVIVKGVVVSTADLYFKASDLVTFPTLYVDISFGGYLYLEADSYWPWAHDGDDTWDTVTGDELEDHKRKDASGQSLLYACSEIV